LQAPFRAVTSPGPPAAPDASLAPEHAASLAAGWQRSRNARARERLVQAFVPTARRIAFAKVRSLPSHVDADDVVAGAYLGLLHAIDGFDPTLGDFETYARHRIAGTIVDELRRLDHRPDGIRQIERRVRVAEQQLREDLGREPTRVELAGELGVPAEDLDEDLVVLERTAPASLEAVTEDVVTLPRESQPEQLVVDKAEQADRARRIRAAARTLSSRERVALRLVCIEERSHVEAGRMLGISESRVANLVARAKLKLKASAAPRARPVAG
jgi:RNA polymerase sigma factor FliA